MMVVRDAVRCQNEYLSAPFLVAECGSVLEMPSFGTIFSGEWGFGVRKAIYRHHFLWRGRFGVRKGIFRHHFLWRVHFGVRKGIFWHHFMWRDVRPFYWTVKHLFNM